MNSKINFCAPVQFVMFLVDSSLNSENVALDLEMEV